MQIITHKGTHQIGGTCIELNAEGQGLLLDIGMPLVNPDGSEFDDDSVNQPIEELINGNILPKVQGLYDGAPGKIAGIILSHAHRDHYGLGHFIKPDIPIFASEITKKLIAANRMFFPDQIDPDRIQPLEAWNPVFIGPFKVRAHPVDHSAPGAIAIEVEACGKKVFFTGDLRAHGYKKKLFENIIKRPPKNVDIMLMEGSSFGRKVDEYPFSDEPTVRDALIAEIKNTNCLALLFCASQNIDRIVSAYRAAQATGRVFVIDYYTAFILYLLKDESKNIPQFFNSDIRFLYWPGHGDALAKSGHIGFLKALKNQKKRIYPEEITANPGKFFVLAKANKRLAFLTKGLASDKIKCIWSMWSGYLKDPDNPFVEFCKNNGINYKQIHTSGHATIMDLNRLANAVNPKLMVPVHTFYPDDYQQFKVPLHVMNDGDSMNL